MKGPSFRFPTHFLWVSNHLNSRCTDCLTVCRVQRGRQVLPQTALKQLAFSLSLGFKTGRRKLPGGRELFLEGGSSLFNTAYSLVTDSKSCPVKAAVVPMVASLYSFSCSSFSSSSRSPSMASPSYLPHLDVKVNIFGGCLSEGQSLVFGILLCPTHY